MVRIARVVPVDGDDVVVVSAGPHPSFVPSRVGRFFVRLVGPRDVYDLIEERDVGGVRARQEATPSGGTYSYVL